MSRRVGKEMPDALFARMRGRQAQAGKVVVMATVDDQGWAHPAMASCFEMVAKTPSRIHLAVGRNSTTERNLLRTGAMTFVVTDAGVNFYLKGAARRTREQLADTMFALFQVELHTVLEDQDPGAAIVTGIRYEWNASDSAAFMRQMLDRTLEALTAAPWE